MARNLRLDDILTRHQVFVQRLSRAEANKFAKFLKEADNELRDKLSGDELTDYSRRRLESQLADVEELLGAVYKRFADQFTKSAVEFGQHEADFTSRALKVIAEVETAIPATSQITAAVFGDPLAVTGHGGGKLLKDFLSDWTRAEVKAVSGAIRRGVFQGKTNSEIVQSIRGTRAARFADGLLETTSRNARTIVQTAVQHVSSQARLLTFEENGDIVVGVEWLATLDSRTCMACAALDLKEFPLDKGPRPPLHINCRCTTTAVLNEKFSAFNKRTARPAVGPDGAEAASAGVPYYAWLKQQPEEFQVAAIGVKRARLLRDGGLSIDRFSQLQLDKNFEPMTLADMKLLEPLAFKEAGVK